MNRLPYDCCRCGGHNCARKSDCLRHAEMSNMGPATPWTERYCTKVGGEDQGFIAIKEIRK